MTSFMAAVPSESPGELTKFQSANRLSHTAFQAKGYLPALPTWRPRDGRNEAYLKWHDALVRFEHDSGIDIDATLPSTSELVEMIPHIFTKGPVTTDERELLNLFHASRDEWVDQNEALYDVIRSSLDLDGPTLERDLRKLASLMYSTKDGRAIRKWAKTFADLNTVSLQADLHTKLEVKLPQSSTIADLETHCNKLWSSWLLISGNDPDSIAKLESFHFRWLNSLPSEPVGSHLASVRKWLADKISERSTVLHDVDSAIDVMVKYAKSIGLDDTSARYHDASAAFALFGKKNNCKFCKANACQSENEGGPACCICRWNSKVPIENVLGNVDAKAMVLGLREHHEQNKDATSLKGIHVDLDACRTKVRAILDSKPKADNPGAAAQVTPVFSVDSIMATPFGAEVTDKDALENWLNGRTSGTASAGAVNMIGALDIASPRPRKSPYMAQWQQRLRDFRNNSAVSYSPYAAQTVNVLDDNTAKGDNFTAVVRILDKSISADKAPRGPLSRLRAVQAFLTWAARLGVPHIKVRNVICAAAGLHLLYHLTGSRNRKQLVTRLKLALHAAIVRLVYKLLSPVISAALVEQITLA